jgi:very-short-patch-repair endonuclease
MACVPTMSGVPDGSEARRLAEQHHGAVSRAQLRDAGLTFRAIDQLARSRNWTAVTRRVFRRTGSPDTAEQRLTIAVLDAGPGAVLSHLTAAQRWGLAGCPLEPINVTRASTTSWVTGRAIVHRVRSLPPIWTTTLQHIPIVRPELLALQLFAVCSFGRAERLTDRLWSMRLLSGPSIERFLDDHGRRGRNGTAGVRTYLEARGPSYVPPASGLESRFMELMAGAGIPMRRQVDSGGTDHWTGRVDFRHVVLPVIVEIQSEAYHTALCDHVADAARIDRLRADGFRVVEITDTMIWATPSVVTQIVRQALDSVRLPAP